MHAAKQNRQHSTLLFQNYCRNMFGLFVSQSSQPLQQANKKIIKWGCPHQWFQLFTSTCTTVELLVLRLTVSIMSRLENSNYQQAQIGLDNYSSSITHQSMWPWARNASPLSKAGATHGDSVTHRLEPFHSAWVGSDTTAIASINFQFILELLFCDMFVHVTSGSFFNHASS